MNDDIKEILDIERYRNKDDYVENISLMPDDIHKLLDYITNLQQENQELKKNQRYYKNGVFSLEYDKETMSDMIDDYKSRVEKANAYMDYYWISYEDSKKDENYEDELEVLVREIYDLYCILNGKE